MATGCRRRKPRLGLAVLDRNDLLTNREREVLQLVAQGMSYEEMGERPAISPRTAETHRGNALCKLGLKDQAESVRSVLSRGRLGR